MTKKKKKNSHNILTLLEMYFISQNWYRLPQLISRLYIETHHHIEYRTAIVVPVSLAENLLLFPFK